MNSAPIIIADWTADSEDRWIVPLGAGGGKLVMLGGKLPLNLQTQLYYNVVRPDFGPEWQWRAQDVKDKLIEPWDVISAIPPSSIKAGVLHILKCNNFP